MFVVELAVSQCVSHGILPTVVTIQAYAFLMLAETWHQPYAFRSAFGALLAIFAWALVSNDILCSSHVNIWLIFFAHLHGLCLMDSTDFKWARNALRDGVKSLNDTFS